MTVNVFRRLDTARGEQGEHIPTLNPELFGKTEDELPAGNPAGAVPGSEKINAEEYLVEEAAAPEADAPEAPVEEAAAPEAPVEESPAEEASEETPEDPSEV